MGSFGSLPILKSDDTAEFRDPVCGMSVIPERAAAVVEHDGRRFYFCSKSCAEKFRQSPQQYLGDGAQTGSRGFPSVGSTSSPQSQSRPPGGAKYTCPMHPEIVRDQPGSCPICGMALEPR